MRTKVGMALAAALAVAACDPAPPPVPPPVVVPPAPARPTYDFTFTLAHKIKADGLVMNPGFSPDGRHVAAMIHNGGLAVWETETWERVKCKSTNERMWGLVAWSPTGRYLAVAQGSPACLELIDWKERRSVAMFDKIEHQSEDGDTPQEIMFSSEEKFIAVSWFNGSISIHRIDNRERFMVLGEGHSSIPLSFSDSKEQLITSGMPTVEIDDLALRRESGLRVYSTNPWILKACLVDRDVGANQGGHLTEDRLVTIGSMNQDNTIIKTWSRDPLKELSRRTHEGILVGCAVHRPTAHVASTESTKEDKTSRILGIQIFDPLGGYNRSVATVDSIFKDLGQPATGQMNLSFSPAGFSPDGKQFAIGFSEGWLLIFDVAFKKTP